jgi:hypothetical protein
LDYLVLPPFEVFASTLYTVNIDGTGFAELYSFPEGGSPLLTLSGNTIFGTTPLGGTADNGTIFRTSFLPRVTVTRSESNIVLARPTNYAGFDYTGYTLQSTTNLVAPVWTTNFPAPVLVNGQNTVTNPISSIQHFFRLIQ